MAVPVLLTVLLTPAATAAAHAELGHNDVLVGVPAWPSMLEIEQAALTVHPTLLLGEPFPGVALAPDRVRAPLPLGGARPQVAVVPAASLRLRNGRSGGAILTVLTQAVLTLGVAEILQALDLSFRGCRAGRPLTGILTEILAVDEIA